MKTIKKYLGIFLSLLLVATMGCTEFPEVLDDSIKADPAGDSELMKSENKSVVSLTEQEIEGLFYMREEEKLAHDVYYQFYEWYGRTIFLNICESEQKHTDAVLHLLNIYGLTDPASATIGVFNNEILQALYDKLIEDGTGGLISALEVGVVIEETDIEDINRLMDQTKVKNILQVYGNLLSGSANHLSAFERELEKVESKQN